MRRWKIRFTLRGIRQETVIEAPSQLLALMLVKAMYAGTDAHAFSADEIH